MPENPAATPYVAGALGVSGGAIATITAAGGVAVFNGVSRLMWTGVGAPLTAGEALAFGASTPYMVANWAAPYVAGAWTATYNAAMVLRVQRPDTIFLALGAIGVAAEIVSEQDVIELPRPRPSPAEFALWIIDDFLSAWKQCP
jgi:hypothetical protein